MPATFETVTGYDEATLKEAFDLVSNPDDWRSPFAAWVPANQLSLYGAAVTFYTATSLKVLRYRFSSENGREAYVFSAGYRNGPAGP